MIATALFSIKTRSNQLNLLTTAHHSRLMQAITESRSYIYAQLPRSTQLHVVRQLPAVLIALIANSHLRPAYTLYTAMARNGW